MAQDDDDEADNYINTEYPANDNIINTRSNTDDVKDEDIMQHISPDYSPTVTGCGLTMKQPSICIRCMQMMMTMVMMMLQVSEMGPV